RGIAPAGRGQRPRDTGGRLYGYRPSIEFLMAPRPYAY
ncbi:MAG: hypothetical protein RLZZ501_2453, partial [Pseudomonadota bacterium]